MEPAGRTIDENTTLRELGEILGARGARLEVFRTHGSRLWTALIHVGGLVDAGRAEQLAVAVAVAVSSMDEQVRR